MCGSLRFAQRAEEDEQIDDPDDRQPQVDVPLGLGVLLALGDAEQVARAGEHDEELIAPEHEPGRPAAGEARVAGALHDVERGGEQHVAAEGEDHGRGVQRPQAAEVGPGQVEVERGEGQLPGDDVADEEAGDAPEHGGDGGHLDGAVHVAVLLVLAARAWMRGDVVSARGEEDEEQKTVEGHHRVARSERQGERPAGTGYGNQECYRVRKGNGLFPRRHRHPPAFFLGSDKQRLAKAMFEGEREYRFDLGQGAAMWALRL